MTRKEKIVAYLEEKKQGFCAELLAPWFGSVETRPKKSRPGVRELHGEFILKYIQATNMSEEDFDNMSNEEVKLFLTTPYVCETRRNPLVEYLPFDSEECLHMFS